MIMFPQLKEALFLASAYGSIRGYVSTLTGLHRYRARQGTPSRWELNWLRNHRVQGGAAAIFKVTGNRLDKLYQRYNAWIIIPLHDAFIFEAPINVLREVAALTELVMCETIQEFFPLLKPKVEVNIQHPECWNKDGEVEPLTRLIEEWKKLTAPGQKD